MSVPFLLCRNGTDCPFRSYFFRHSILIMPPVLITRARGDGKGREDSKNESQNDRANRLSVSRLLRNLALQLLGPAVNHHALQPALYRTYTSRGCGRAACNKNCLLRVPGGTFTRYSSDITRELRPVFTREIAFQRQNLHVNW